jgi:steroid delta-isomerase-like uncharacterized protein
MIIDGKRAADRAIETILAYYSAFNRRDWNAMLGVLTEDVAHDPNQGERQAGLEAFRAFLVRMDESYAEQLRNIVVTATPDGRHAAAEYMVHGEYKKQDAGLPPARGQKYVLPGGAFFTLRDGKLARVTNYYNLHDWIRQVEAG